MKYSKESNRTTDAAACGRVRISAIVPTFNRCKELQGTLKSLRSQTLPSDDYEIIVVDNGSRDATHDVVSSLNKKGGKEIFYVREERLGLHFARHAGTSAARGEILAFTDDDAIVDAMWLRALLNVYGDDTVECAGGKILPIWEVEPPDWVRPYGPGYLSLLDLGDKIIELKKPGIYGCNFSIRKSLLFQLHGFNPDSFGDFWLGDGETGLLRKVLDAGLKIIYTPNAIVHHIIPGSRVTLEYLKRRSSNEGACSSYAAYKRKRPGRARLLLGCLKHAAKWMVLRTFAAGNGILGQEARFHNQIRASYYWRRIWYDLRLIYDKSLRDLVEKDDWL